MKAVSEGEKVVLEEEKVAPRREDAKEPRWHSES